MKNKYKRLKRSFIFIRSVHKKIWTCIPQISNKYLKRLVGSETYTFSYFLGMHTTDQQ